MIKTSKTAQTIETSICSFCGQKFESRKTLKLHVAQEHMNKTELDCLDQKYSCKQCDFTTASSVVLRNHELVHSYTKTCPHCSKKFYQDSHLKFHLMTHQKNGPVIISKSKVTVVEKLPLEESSEVIGSNSQKRKKIKIKETSPIKQELNTPDENETEIQEDPVICSSCCNMRFDDLLSLLTHVQQSHTQTFTKVMNTLQPFTEESDNKTEEEVVFVKFQSHKNGYDLYEQ